MQEGSEDLKTHAAENIYVTVFLVTGICMFLIAFATNDAFFTWAFERHQNTLSWWLRPLLMLPFCYFAYRRRVNNVLLTVLGILTSMFWFPVPEQVDPQVSVFLAMEKDYLTNGWTLGKLASGLAIIGFFIAITMALWKRSVFLGIGIAVAGALAKILWSLHASPESGSAIIPYAATGAIVLVVGALVFLRWEQK